MEIHTGSDRIGFALLCCGIGCAILGPETASGTTSAHCRASHRRILSGVRHVEFVEDVTNNRLYWLVETLRSFGGLDSGTTLSFLNSGRVCQVSSLQLSRHKLPSPRHFQHQRQKPSSAQQSTSISMVVIHLCHSSKQQAHCNSTHQHRKLGLIQIQSLASNMKPPPSKWAASSEPTSGL